MGKVDLSLAPSNIPAAPQGVGCPSGLQAQRVSEIDPLGGSADLTPYVTTPSTNHHSIDLIVQGAHCGGCLAKIEKGVGAIDGVDQARMNLSTLRLHVEWGGKAKKVNQIVEKLYSLGFGAAVYDVSDVNQSAQSETRAFLKAMAVAGFATMNVMLLSIAVWSGGADMSEQTRTLFHLISAAIALPAIAYSGRPFFKSALKALRAKQTNMDVPISLAIILASSLSIYETIKGHPDTYFDAAVMLLFLLLIGRYLDARLRFQTGEAARRLAALQVTSATRLLEGSMIETVPARAINPGDRLLIPAGQRLPVDCIIESGNSEIDMQIATGETKLQVYGPGDTLYSGTTNHTAPLTVKAIAKYSDSFLAEITELVEAGEQKKSKFVRIADRAARAYVPVVHSVAALTFIGWLIVGADLRMASLCAIAVLIITCPCALGLAVPAVQIVAAGRLFKQGVLIKSGDALERLAKTKLVIFDKTGTLTKGELSLSNADILSPYVLSLAGCLAQYSSHPVSRALQPYAKEFALEEVEEIHGQGLSAKFEGVVIKLGSATFTGALADDQAAENRVWFKIGADKPIMLLLDDTLRADSEMTLEALHQAGISTELLSGDNKGVVSALARRLNLQHFQGEVSPKGKMEVIQHRQADGLFPLMVGDGINDAPALAAANSSASLASAADVSRSTADIILQGDKLSRLPDALHTARQAQRRIVENLTLAILYNFVAIPLAIFGFVNPLIAALAMSGSSLLVTLNALRMAKFKSAS